MQLRYGCPASSSAPARARGIHDGRRVRRSVVSLVRMGVLALLLLASTTAPSLAGPDRSIISQSADGWITHPAATDKARPIVLRFRRTVDIGEMPRNYPIAITADNRFILYVNGQRVLSGPSTGDVRHWRYASLDLAPYLKSGRNVLAAAVWNGVRPATPIPADATKAQREMILGKDLYTQTAPLFQQSVATGFRLDGQGAAAEISTRRSEWRVKVDPGHTMTSGLLQALPGYYVAGAPESIDAAKAAWEWSGPAETGDGWIDAVPAPAAVQRTLVVDRLPPQKYAQVDPGEVIRTDLPGGYVFPEAPVTVPPNSHVKLLIRRGAMISAYPVLRVSGGAGASVKVEYGEALYDAKGKKGDRNLVGERELEGVFDTFLPDGPVREFAPLWWRTWRYLEIDAKTAAEPLRLEGLAVFETGYPFEQVAQFASSDPQLDRIWQIGWRTAQ